MRVFIKNKIFSLGGSSSVVNERSENVYLVKGNVFSITSKKRICDLSGNVLYSVRNKYFNFILPKIFVYDADKNKLARIKKQPFSNRFIVEGYKDEISIEGEFFSLTSTILRNGVPIGTISRQFTLIADSFSLEADEKDMPFLIALVIAIDNFYDKILKS